MARKSGDVIESSRSAHWQSGISQIMYDRRNEIKAAIRRNDRALGRAEENCDRAERRFTAAKIKFGRNSGHKDYQRADMERLRLERDKKFHQSESERLAKLLTKVDQEQYALVNSVRTFLGGDRPQVEVHSMRFKVLDGGDVLDVFIPNAINKSGTNWAGRNYIFKLDEKMYDPLRRR